MWFYGPKKVETHLVCMVLELLQKTVAESSKKFDFKELSRFWFFFKVILRFSGTPKNFEKLAYFDVMKCWTLHKLLEEENDKEYFSVYILRKYLAKQKIEEEIAFVLNSILLFLVRKKKLFLWMDTKCYSSIYVKKKTSF